MTAAVFFGLVSLLLFIWGACFVICEVRAAKEEAERKSRREALRSVKLVCPRDSLGQMPEQ